MEKPADAIHFFLNLLIGTDVEKSLTMNEVNDHDQDRCGAIKIGLNHS